MAPKVPPLEHFPQGSNAEASWSPRLSEQMTPRALWELIKEDPTWGVLVNDPSGAFSKGDIISVRYQKYLHEVLPIMVSQDASFKTAIDMLAEQTGGKALSPQSKGVLSSAPASSPKSAKLRKEVMKDQGKDVPKLREAVDEKDHPDLKAIDEKDATFHEVEPKALDMDMEHEQKSITTRARDFTKATERSSSEPIAPKRPDQEHALLRQGAVQMLRAEQMAERVVFVETRPQVQNKEIAIQTEEVHAGAPSEPLLQPLLSRTPVASAKPKARRKPKEAKKEVPIQYQDCSCSRICFSSTMKFIVACVVALAVVWCEENCNKVLAFFGGSMVKEPFAPSPKHSKSKSKHIAKEPKDSKHHESHDESHGKHPQSGSKPAPVNPPEPRHEEKPESHSHEGAVRREGQVVRTTSPPTDLELAKEERSKDLKELERLEEEQAETARVGELARLSQQEHEKMAKTQNKDSNLRQAALDAEVQASAAQRELDEDAEIRKQKQKVKDAQALIDQLETAKMDQQGFLAMT